jgi:hypothetical protein
MAARKIRRRKSDETALSAAIQQTLTAKGCRVVRIQAGILPVKRGDKTAYVHCAKKGTPDLLVISPVRFSSGLASEGALALHTWLEVKAVNGEVTQEQIEWHHWAALSGVRVAIVRSISEAIAAVTRE